MGFPTANVSLHKDIAEGIYISKTRVKNKTHNSISFIGTVKTFNETKFHAETYLLDFNKNIYGQWITVELLKKLRENKKFKNADELVKQMKKDEEEARNYFTKYEIDKD